MTLYAFVKDAAGNVSTCLAAAVAVTVPRVTAFIIPNSGTSLTIPITLLTAANTAGLSGYMVTESPSKPVSTAAGWSATAPASFTVAHSGYTTLYGWARDALGNVSASKSASTNIILPSQSSTTPPKIAAGSSYTVILKNDGTVWAWGHTGGTGRRKAQCAHFPSESTHTDPRTFGLALPQNAKRPVRKPA